MPTYAYQCAKGHQFELFQRISDKPVSRCPTCRAKASRIISGGAGLIFKGSGFYITDYGKDGKGPRKADVGGEGGGEAKADSAAKGESKAKSESAGAPESSAKKESKKTKKEAS